MCPWLPRATKLLLLAAFHFGCAATRAQSAPAPARAAAEPGYSIQYAITVPGTKPRAGVPNVLDVDHENPLLIGRLYASPDYRRYLYIFFREEYYPKLADTKPAFAWDRQHVRACIGNDGVAAWYVAYAEVDRPDSTTPVDRMRMSPADLRQGAAAAKLVPADATARHAVFDATTGLWVTQKPDWIVFVELCDQIQRIVGPANDASLPPASKYWKSSTAQLAELADRAGSDELTTHIYLPEQIPTKGLPPHAQPYQGGKWACALGWNKKTGGIEKAKISWAPETFFGYWPYPYPRKFSIVGPPIPIPAENEKAVKWASETGKAGK